MTKPKDDIPSTFIHDTERYTHEDIDGIKDADFDPESFKTVSLPNGNKLVVAKNTKTKKLEGVRILIRKK